MNLINTSKKGSDAIDTREWHLIPVEHKLSDIGCSLASPFMTISFLALPVIPDLKLSDKGLFDVKKFRFVDVIKSNNK